MSCLILLLFFVGDIKAQASAQVIKLYEVRARAAKVDLRIDNLDMEYKKIVYDNLRTLGVTGAVPQNIVTEAKYNYLKAVATVESGEIAVEEAMVQAEILKLGLESGLIKLDDIRIVTEPRQRWK